MKRNPTEWEKIFIRKSTEMGLIFSTYKQLMQNNIKKKKTQKQPNQKMSR